MSRKRGRSASRAEVAAAIGARNNAKYPVSEYGRAYMRRGYEPGYSMFGPSYAEATPAQRGNRKDYGYVGRGKYWGKALGSALGGIGGMFLGGPKGAAIGSSLGGSLGDKWTGKGLYTGRGSYGGGCGCASTSAPATNSNELMASSKLSSPKFASVNDESGSLIVRHREYIGDIFAPGGDSADVSKFTIQSFPINPGLEQTFPWLSQIAQNYEEYEMIQLVFEFASTVQDINSANGQVGTVLTATQYNPSDGDFTDKPAMAAYAHSISGKSVDNQNHGVECDPSKMSGAEGKYIRANPVMTGEDLKTYDHGRFQLATHNIPHAMAGGTIGELYVSYTVKLRKPKFFTGRGLGLTRYLAVADQSNGSLMSHLRPFGTDATTLIARQNNINLKIVRADNRTTITFPAFYGGRLRIMFLIEGTDLTVTSGAHWLADQEVTGNVTLVKDVYCASTASAGGVGDSPGSVFGTGDAYRQVAYFSVNVSPVTNAIDNTFTFVSRLGSGDGSTDSVFNQSSIEVTEHNTFGAEGGVQLVNMAGTAINMV